MQFVRAFEGPIKVLMVGVYVSVLLLIAHHLAS